MTDALADVANLPGVSGAVDEARGAVDRLLGHRILRRRSAEVSTESALRGARASAVLDGATVTLDALRTTENPSDPVVQGSLRVSAELGTLTETWRNAPRQALARLHALAAANAVDSTDLGRLRTGADALSPSEAAARLDVLSTLLTEPTKAPALVVAAIVHGELLTVRPFGWGDGLVARAAQRLTLIARGLDPKSLVAPEVGHLELADEYGEALSAYSSGTAEGVAQWIAHCSAAVAAAARDSQAICEAFMRG
ncbi:oxidoreductase [Actinomadura meridiana]|uniref:oxidoreductase n=1 Tax=Actinomadura meridiana TaxID=559626 RepID=UPI0031EC533A